ncbi:surface lipoprotein assembly modifier [Pasteurellaceae bacterium LIM206]|nr:surface lipoprotein assembly modifier [Pasteurellaceae bacterium LIM206]
MQINYLTKVLLTFLLCGGSTWTMGATVAIREVNPEEKPLITPLKPVTPPAVSPQLLRKSMQFTINASELAKRPDLLVRALIPALYDNNTSAVKALLPIYRQLPAHQQDKLLMTWAEAIVARGEGNLAESVHLYRELIAAQPKLIPVRFQLAIALFENQENEAATDQFEKLRTEPLSHELQHVINRYLQALLSRDQWRFSGAVTYLNEENVNNAPKKGTRINGWTPDEEPEHAEGIGYYFSADKKWSLVQGWFSQFTLEGRGKYFWNNKKYNEFAARAEVGIGYRNQRAEIAVKPFFEQFLYANGESRNASMTGTLHRYSNTVGGHVVGSYWLSPRWLFSADIETGHSVYTRKTYLDGNYYVVSPTLLFMPNARQYWFIGADYYRKNARQGFNAFQREGIRLGWGQEWKGISTRLQLSYAHRHYKSAVTKSRTFFAPPFYAEKQKNREFGITLSLWHRQLHWLGITPRLTWAYQQTDSNHPFAEYDKNRVYLEFGKTF